MGFVRLLIRSARCSVLIQWLSANSCLTNIPRFIFYNIVAMLWFCAGLGIAMYWFLSGSTCPFNFFGICYSVNSFLCCL